MLCVQLLQCWPRNQRLSIKYNEGVLQASLTLPMPIIMSETGLSPSKVDK